MVKTRVGASSPLFLTKQTGGGFTVADMSIYPGNIFWVDSGDGSDTTGYGLSPDTPFATIDYAVGQCTASQGDVIFVLPGHSETVTAAAGIDLDVAGITIQGIGSGSDMPTIDFTTAATADVEVAAANVTVRGLHFTAGFADVANAIDVNADDFTIEDCRFSEPTTNENFLVCVQDAAAGASDRITIRRCRAEGLLDAANTHFVNFVGTGTGHIVEDNVLIGDWGTMAIGGAGVITYCSIQRNTIMNEASDNDSCISVAATATGIIANNLCGGAAAQANGITTGNCLAAENYYGVHTEDLSAILEPAGT